ncbi:MAG: hypothetical protein HYY18_03440 [Planctomycetes bacterium]|nr:hypothetical protein [Planctomycetota bacterium]
MDAEKDIRIFFAVEVLPGRISNRPFEKLSPSEREKLFVGQQNLKFRRVPWNGIEINVVEGRTTVSGEEILTVFAQFPLPKRGVQITLGTTAAYEDLMMADLQGIIGSFQGRADPVDPHEGDVAYSIGKLTAWAMMLAIPGYFIVRLIKREISGGSRPPEARMEPPKDNPTFHV